MCRIFGACCLRGDSFIDKEIIEKLQVSLVHGGPDEIGIESIDSCMLGINRLAIMDPAGGQQPFDTSCATVVYNGEIYNHKELRDILKEKNIAFQTECDGEVIPYLYHVYGIEAFKKLDGMFACALWDKKKQALVLARDHAGMKPLFYTVIDGLLIFSSEISALLSLAPINKDVSHLAMDKYFSLKAVYTLESPIGTVTAFPGIWSIPPGHALTWEPNKGLHLEKFIHHPGEKTKITKSEDLEMKLSHLLEEEVAKIVQSDVPICSILSGGLDSSIVTSLVSKQYKEKLHTFTIGYTGTWQGDERHYAREVANYLGTEHHEIELNPDDIPTLLPKVIKHLGQPNADPITVSSYALFQEIKNHGFKVAISGDGSDEIFGGYDRLKDFISSDSHGVENKVANYFSSLAAVSKNLREKLYSPSFKEYLLDMQSSEQVQNRLLRKIRNQPTSEQLNTLLNFEVNHRLPVYHLLRVDHLSAAHALEVRIPFCQKKVVDFAFSIPTNKKISGDGRVKILLSDTAQKYKWVPESIIKRKKQPFTLPISQMLHPDHKLGRFAKEILLDTKVEKRGYFNVDKIESMINQLSNPNNQLSLAIWSLLTLELWFRQFIDSKEERMISV
ncbi:asparagine synthase (glutamine-hydrolyzing) [Niallia sp. 03133]|uniref:asparagine synthase (glutamine-hydrolyzing) n=1 Tax=Niallia sp. 03133 TaxID=3458060 RepID=UPI004044E652